MTNLALWECSGYPLWFYTGPISRPPSLFMRRSDQTDSWFELASEFWLRVLSRIWLELLGHFDFWFLPLPTRNENVRSKTLPNIKCLAVFRNPYLVSGSHAKSSTFGVARATRFVFIRAGPKSESRPLPETPAVPPEKSLPGQWLWTWVYNQANLEPIFVVMPCRALHMHQHARPFSCDCFRRVSLLSYIVRSTAYGISA